jgi:hypothetical protein
MRQAWRMTDEPITDSDLDAIERRAKAASKPPWQSFVEGRDHTSGDDFIRVVDSTTTSPICT